MSRAGTIARRTLLLGGVAIAGGVAFGTVWYRRDPDNPLLDNLAPGTAALTPYVLLDADGVTLIGPRADVGQGAASIQAHLLAEELDVDPHAVRLSPGPASPVYYNAAIAGEGMPFASWDDGILARAARGTSDLAGRLIGLHLTGGSTTVPDGYDRLRLAGASARQTLIAAAAARLGVATGSLRTENGAVIGPDGPIPYPDLIPDLARTDVVQVALEDLRDPSQWRSLGRDHMRTDMVAKSTGTFRYGTDTVLPDMLHAAIVTNPVRGGGVTSMDATEALAMRGVEAILPVTDGAAVLADNDWRAMRAARAIRLTWGGTGPSTAALLAAHAAALDAALDDGPDGSYDSRLADDGDVDAATGDALAAEYFAPHLHHAPMEPANATVRYTPDRTEVWAATQAPVSVAGHVAAITGQDVAQIAIHALPAGGSFGHKLEDEWIRQATEIAVQMPGRPVRLTLSREQDMTHGFWRPMALARGRATHADGQVTSLDLAIATQSVNASMLGRMGYSAPGPDTSIVAGAWDAPYALPDRRVTGVRVAPMLAVSSWRSVGASHNGFFIESLLDEAIHAAGADPVAERLRLLHDDATARVLRTVAEMCAWNGPRPAPGTGRGVAVVLSFGVPVAQVIEVRDTPAGIVMDRLWIAAEVGRVLDPVNIEAQFSGAALFGLGHAISAAITFDDAGAPQQSNYHDYNSLRLWQTPQVEVRALGSGGPIRGAGEPGLPPAAPALANAIFAATGTRLRRMPFARDMTFA